MLKITVIAVGHKMPHWVAEAVNEYKKRLQDKFILSLTEVPLQARGKGSDVSRQLEKEMMLMAASIPSGAYLIALEMNGQSFTSEQLSAKLSKLQHSTSHLCFLIGGPEGLPSSLSRKSHERWSLSPLTLPHTLARIVLLEALYRSWGIAVNHPYHK